MLMFKKFGILGALSELLEPHFFGRTGALKFGTIGVHRSLSLFNIAICPDVLEEWFHVAEGLKGLQVIHGTLTPTIFLEKKRIANEYKFGV